MLRPAAGGHQIQICPAGGVDEHGAAVLARLQALHMIKAAAQDIPQIMQHSARRANAGPHARAAESVQGMDFKM